jgi:hypothetical protein
MTDGVSDICSPPPNGILDRFTRDIERELRRAPHTGDAALRLVRFLTETKVRGSWDDRTLVVVIPNRPAEDGASETAPDRKSEQKTTESQGTPPCNIDGSNEG